MIQPGDLINNRYHVLQELGDGAFGQTFEIEDSFNSTKQVIKILKLSDFSNPDLQRKIRELFEREYDVLRTLLHPGIPVVRTGGYLEFPCPHTHEMLYGIVMEKIEGQNLSSWLKSYYQLTEQKQALDWLKQLTEILQVIHPDYLHRDIKPENIMLKPDGQLVLIDFGAVKELTQKFQKKTNPQTRIGTSGYQSPEQALGTDLTTQSDFFSLGRTLVHLLTGEHPNDILDTQIDTQTDKLSWRQKVTNIVPEFANLIDELMEHNRRDRPRNTQNILQAIQTIERKVQGNETYNFSGWLVISSVLLNVVLLIILALKASLSVGVLWLLFVLVFGVLAFLIFPWLYQKISRILK